MKKKKSKPPPPKPLESDQPLSSPLTCSPPVAVSFSETGNAQTATRRSLVPLLRDVPRTGSDIAAEIAGAAGRLSPAPAVASHPKRKSTFKTLIEGGPSRLSSVASDLSTEEMANVRRGESSEIADVFESPPPIAAVAVRPTAKSALKTTIEGAPTRLNPVLPELPAIAPPNELPMLNTNDNRESPRPSIFEPIVAAKPASKPHPAHTRHASEAQPSSARHAATGSSLTVGDVTSAAASLSPVVIPKKRLRQSTFKAEVEAGPSRLSSVPALSSVQASSTSPEIEGAVSRLSPVTITEETKPARTEMVCIAAAAVARLAPVGSAPPKPKPLTLETIETVPKLGVVKGSKWHVAPQQMLSQVPDASSQRVSSPKSPSSSTSGRSAPTQMLQPDPDGAGAAVETVDPTHRTKHFSKERKKKLSPPPLLVIKDHQQHEQHQHEHQHQRKLHSPSESPLPQTPLPPTPDSWLLPTPTRLAQPNFQTPLPPAPPNVSATHSAVGNIGGDGAGSSVGKVVETKVMDRTLAASVKRGELSAERALKAARWVDKEIRKLIRLIVAHSGGTIDGDGKKTILYGDLFKAAEDTMEALSGTLKTAKKQKVVAYNAEVLFQGQSDAVVISLLKEAIPDSTASTYTYRQVRQASRRIQKKRLPNTTGFGTASLANSNSKCHVCAKTVYPMEYIGASGKAFHKSCFRCKVCSSVLRGDQYATVNGFFYCKPHFEELFKKYGTYNFPSE